ATGDGADALYALPRERFAHGKQLSWLRDRANQVVFWVVFHRPASLLNNTPSFCMVEAAIHRAIP
ncbi:hypothetical protein, partial [Xanthomonas citri]|uniref:hypothetical protein n=2 Tax=Xanthomonas citri TaxID=346 RepID=UPI001CA48101